MSRDADLDRLMSRVFADLGDSLTHAATAKHARLAPVGGASRLDVEGWLWLLDSQRLVVRGDVEIGGETGQLLVSLDLADAIALAGGITKMSPAVIAEHRAAGLWQAHEYGLAELSKLVHGSIDRVLQAAPAGGHCRFRDCAVVRPGFDEAGILTGGDRLIYEFRVQIDHYPASSGHLILDPELAVWLDAGVSHSVAPAVDTAALVSVESDLDLVKLAAQGPWTSSSGFLTSHAAASAVYNTSQQFGLGLKCFDHHEIPNPAAHHHEILFIEVPAGEDKRFEWTRRLKEHNQQLAVVLLVHQPSRSRVIQGVQSRADVVAAWPTDVRQLTEKLIGLWDEPARAGVVR